MEYTVLFGILLLTSSFSASPIGKPLAVSDPEINPDLFQGDILGIDRLSFKQGDEPRNAVRDPELLWPGGVIYYTVRSGQYTENETALINEAFAQYHAKTCLRFVERTDQPNYISMMKTGTGYVGMRGGVQIVSIDSSCFRCSSSSGCTPGSVMHELMHAAGFYHEQSRTDRDEYVTINWENIESGYENNFVSYGQDVIQHLGAPYDYGSVMHYGAYGFAIDPTVPTIIVPEGVEIGQRLGFSEVDLFKLNVLYNCSAPLN